MLFRSTPFRLAVIPYEPLKLRREITLLSFSINADAEKEGADCVVTPCPLCQMQLDMFQEEAKKTVALHKDMPILHMSQLIGLALGISPEEMGMPSRHLTSTAAVEKFVR